MAFSMKLGSDKTKKPKQYGLIIPPKKSKSSAINKTADAFNVFASANVAEHADKGDQVKQSTAKSAAAPTQKKNFQQLQVEKTHQKALEEDPSVFDYDGVYDELQNERKQKAQQQKAKREQDKEKPKYIQALMQKAKIREIENERIRERRLLKERQAEDALYGDKEKLVSASYKRKLMELKKWDEEDARLQAQEDAQDVTKRGDDAMAGFYANLLTKNIAMGSDVQGNSKSAYTVGHQDSAAEKARFATLTSSSIGSRDETYQPKAQIAEESDSDSRSKRRRTTDGVSDSVGATPPQQEEEKNPKKEEVISAARARFLARKAQKQQQQPQQHSQKSSR